MKKNQSYKMSWAEFSVAARLILKKIQASASVFDLIVGISRGGLPLAITLSHSIQCRMFGMVSIQKTRSNKSFDINGDTVAKLDGHFLPESTFKSVLIVDDIVAYGDSIGIAIDLINKRYFPNDIQVATLYVNEERLSERGKSAAQFVNYYYEVVPKCTWIFFPWEISED